MKLSNLLSEYTILKNDIDKINNTLKEKKIILMKKKKQQLNI